MNNYTEELVETVIHECATPQRTAEVCTGILLEVVEADPSASVEVFIDRLKKMGRSRWPGDEELARNILSILLSVPAIKNMREQAIQKAEERLAKRMAEINEWTLQ